MLFFFFFYFLKTNVILLKFTNSQVVSTTSYSETLKKKKTHKTQAHLLKYSPPLKSLVAIFRDLNDLSVFKARNMAFLLPAFSKFLQKHIQVSRFFGWLYIMLFLCVFCRSLFD